MKLKLNEQFDYITLKMPNCNFTLGRSGFKSTGSMPIDIFKKLTEYVNSYSGNSGEAMRSLTDEKTMKSIWPDFDIVLTYNFIIGDIVTVKNYPKYGKGEIFQLKKKSAIIKFLIGHIEVPFSLLEKI